jgi:arylformamidase
MKIGRIVDISLKLDEAYRMHTPAGVKDVQLQIEVLKEHDAVGGAGQIVRGIQMRLHHGTHVDAPEHFVKGGKHLDELPLSTFVGTAVVANLSHKQANSAITAEDLEKAVGDKIKAGDRLLIRTDHNKTYGQPDYLANSPYITPEAVDWCVAKGLVLVGMDFNHTKDAPNSPSKYYCSRAMCSHGVVTMAYLDHLYDVHQDRVTLICLPLAIAGVEASPVRAIVVED